MARKREGLSPTTPLLCGHITWQNTAANIGVKCLHFSRNVMLSFGVSYWKDKGGLHRSWSES